MRRMAALLASAKPSHNNSPKKHQKNGRKNDPKNHRKTG
jgi:hypothetical protein